MRSRAVAVSCALLVMSANVARSKDLRHMTGRSEDRGHMTGRSEDSAQGASAPRAWDERRIPLPRVGSAMAYVPHAPTPHVVLLVSGGAGWDSKMTALAHRIADQAIVVGISYPALKRTVARESGCWYVASDFEIMSHAAQKTLRLSQYHAPILVGYAEGAAIVYAALAGGPATTFAGGVSAAFCPIVAFKRDICAGDAWTPDYDDRKHVNTLPPKRTLPKDWYVLQGSSNRECAPDAASRFVAGIPKAHLANGDALLTSLQDLWTEKEVKPPAAQPRSATTRELEDELQRLQLPLEFRWPSSSLSALLLFFSGDGGWASLDEEVAERLVSQGVGVVGVSSLRYFWQAKPSAQVAGDIRRLTTVLARAAKPMFAGGFSFGAEVVPVALAEWTPMERRGLAGLVLIAPGPSASFEIDPLDWVRKPQPNAATRVDAAVRADAVSTLCLSGADEDDSPCSALTAAAGVRAVQLPGSHHFNSNYSAVGQIVAEFIRASSEKRP
jgi:type IV secretory pathway VirJ component